MTELSTSQWQTKITYNKYSRVDSNMKIHDFSDIFACLEGTFKLQMRAGSHPDQAPHRRVAYALQESL